jgi:hypothetical protein
MALLDSQASFICSSDNRDMKMTILWCVDGTTLKGDNLSFKTEVYLNFIQKPTSAAEKKVPIEKNE